MADLTPKQKRFCEEYIIDLNGTQAAIRAGYSEKSSMEQSYQLLQKTPVKEYVQSLMDQRSDETWLNAKFVLDGIKDTIKSAKALDDHGPALKGYELLGKHLKLFTDKLEQSGDMVVTIKHAVPDAPNSGN